MFALKPAILFAAILLPVPCSYAQISSLAGGELGRQAEQVRLDLASSDKYSEISDADRTTVLSLLDRLESQLDGVANVDGLPEHAKLAVFNDQEQVNGILTGAEADSRMVCRREVMVGSNRRQNVCMTFAQRRRLAEGAREDLGDMQRLFAPKSE